jgi:hypothetical protein
MLPEGFLEGLLDAMSKARFAQKPDEELTEIGTLTDEEAGYMDTMIARTKVNAEKHRACHEEDELLAAERKIFKARLSNRLGKAGKTKSWKITKDNKVLCDMADDEEEYRQMPGPEN